MKMTSLRSNKPVLFAAVVFIFLCLGLAHYHLRSITDFTSVQSGVDEPTHFTPEKEAAAPAAPVVPEEDEVIAAKPGVIVYPATDVPAKPEAAAESPDTTESETKPEGEGEPKEDAAAEQDQAESAPDPSPSPEAAPEVDAPEAASGPNLDAFTPDKWIQPAVKVDEHEYYPYGVWPIELPSAKPIWTKPLGKKLCIIDLESRRFDQPGQLWSDEMTWNKSQNVHGPSGGSLNHWVYSQIHGYEYYHITINGYADRRDSWKKPSVLSQVLKKHDVCVFIDSDALFNRLDLPMEWLMNYWNISPKNNSLALPFDPDVEHNRDRHGNLFLNTGFIIMQNKPKTYEIFKEWDDCANDGGKFPGCTEFRNRKGWQPTDQGGFGTFIRYEYPNDIISLPCTEANGFPESNTNCQGKFIKHVWLGKEDRLVQAVGAVFPGVLLETFHKQFLKASVNFKTSEDELIKANGLPW